MTISVLAALIILISLPVSYGFVKFISWAYEARDADSKELERYTQHKQRYLDYFN